MSACDIRNCFMSHCISSQTETLPILLNLITINSHTVGYRSVRWLGNTKQTTNFDDLLNGMNVNFYIGLISTFNVSQCNNCQLSRSDYYYTGHFVIWCMGLVGYSNYCIKHFHTSDQREFLWFKCDISQPQFSRCVTTSLLYYNFPVECI